MASAADERELRKLIRLLEQENEVLAASGGVSVAGEPEARWLPTMIYPPRRRTRRGRHSVTVTYGVLKIARQPFDRWRRCPVRCLVVAGGWGSAELAAPPTTTSQASIW